MSERIAIVTDSNSGISQSMAKQLGIFAVPMPFLVNQETFYEDINLTQEAFYEHLRSDADISTSQPDIGTLLDLWDRLLEDYDAVVHIPMSSSLSGSCATAMALAEDYGGRVVVVDNQRISVTQRQAVMDALTLAKAGKSVGEIREILEQVKAASSIYIMMDTLKYLKKGGRVTPAAAALATVLRIRPVLQIQGGRLDTFAKARSERHGRQIMIDAMKKDIENRFGGIDRVRVFVAHTHNDGLAHDFAQDIEQQLGTAVTYCDPLSLSVACHIGPGALAIGCSEIIDPYL